MPGDEGGGELAPFLRLKVGDDGRHLLGQRPRLREEVVLRVEVPQQPLEHDRRLRLVAELRHVWEMVDALKRPEGADALVTDR